MSSIDAYYVYTDTRVKLVRLGDSYCIAFDFKKKSMTGIAVADANVAYVLSNYFKAMAKVLDEKVKKNKTIKKAKVKA